ncbi:beta-hexosaminidase subunit alpha-like isoform X1 [Xyrauchen texanus]|uniref:beta-hexosaminidase subunit alpha-like isoform X1 n=1 Tax=Xyrauchen texanus TaxID=154827 RepID=UPI002241FEC3|nr:beta-hexosaminidase subunit alpha-like isoform X1 [Xyrauchen texanus]
MAQIYNLQFSFLLVLLCHTVDQVNGVWPLPQQIDVSADRYSLSPQLFSFTYGKFSAAQSGCSVLDAAFKRYFSIIFPDFTDGSASGLPHQIWSEPKPFGVSVSVKTKGCDGYPDEDSNESYNLSVSEGQAVLTSVSVWGALRGLESLSQLVYQDDYGAYFINKTEIVDFPRFAFRGLLLDTSRHYLPLHAILKNLDAMAYSKFNVFHWHIVDDPSFPYQSRTFPDLSNKGAFHPFTHIYTQSDVMRVIEHARMRGIRVVPEFDSPGHTQSWGRGQPDLLTPCYKGSVPSGLFGPVNPTLDTTYKFMERLFKEVKSVFPDSYVHIGGDEVRFSCWQSNPDVKKFMEKMGFGKDFTKLESFYMESIMNMTTALNKTSIVWQDVFDYHERIPQDTVLEIWKGTTKQYYAELSRMTKAGHRVLLSAPWYINHISYGQDWRNSYAVRPQHFSGTEEQKKLVIGGEVAMWGEYVDATNLNTRLWPRACAAAERLWSDEEKTLNADLAFPRLEEFRCKLLRRGIQAEPLFVGHCKHEYNGF